MKKLTRFVSVLLSALMVASMFTALNFTAFAADSKLTIRANSNIFPTQTQEFDADTNQITVTHMVDAGVRRQYGQHPVRHHLRQLKARG